MGILASSGEGCLGYTKQVRWEYAHLTDEELWKGRATFLRSEIEKGKVILLEDIEMERECALENMRAELSMLDSEDVEEGNIAEKRVLRPCSFGVLHRTRCNSH